LEALLAINPPSDIVLDVLNAADPTRAEATTRRLTALGAMANAASASTDFSQVLDSSGQALASGLGSARGAADARTRFMKKDLLASQKAAKVKVEFEASILNSFIGEMLPKNASGVYGEGTAGDIWKSMLADQIAHQIAKSGELGISRKLFATHLLPHQGRGAGDSSVSSGGAADAAQASANPLSMPSSVDYTNGAFLFTDKKPS
jgi:Rod binding domain-containing protein